MPAFNLIFRPWVNSYRRVNCHLGAPENASWGKEHHFAAIRVVNGSAPAKLTRFEHRVPGADVNPYLSVASILKGTLRGIRGNLMPPPFATGDILDDKNGARLPHSMPEAIELFRKSAVAAEDFGPAFVEHFTFVKQEEWQDFADAVASPEAALGKGPVTDCGVPATSILPDGASGYLHEARQRRHVGVSYQLLDASEEHPVFARGRNGRSVFVIVVDHASRRLRSGLGIWDCRRPSSRGTSPGTSAPWKSVNRSHEHSMRR